MQKLLLAFAALLLAFSATAQTKTLPASNVKTLEGQSVTVKDLAPAGKITVFSFWATWCKPCIQELESIKELYPDWQKDYQVELIAVSVDDARTLARVKPFVSSKGWPFTIVTDVAKEFQQAMGVTNPPLTVLVNQKGEVVMEHLGYTPGDEDELAEKIKELAKQ